MINQEVKEHKKANAALQKSVIEQSSLENKVQSLSQKLKAALDEIHNLFVDLVTTRSLYDAALKERQQESQAGTSVLQNPANL